MDWRKALAWYMFHVYHDQGTHFVRMHGGMNCMPPEFKAAIQEVAKELEANNQGRLTKPDGTEY